MIRVTMTQAGQELGHDTIFATNLMGVYVGTGWNVSNEIGNWVVLGVGES